jgi:hypothetical protein
VATCFFDIDATTKEPEMPQAVETSEKNTQVARSLAVLIPLIKNDLKNAKEAAQAASVPYYRAAGEKMIEAKAQLKHGEFSSWIKRHFKITAKHASLYIQYAIATRTNQKLAPAPTFESLDDFRRRHLGHERIPGSQRDTWRSDVSDLAAKARTSQQRIENLNEDRITRQQEREAERALALKLIDIGYKVLAKELHPDKGGSRGAMQRLVVVRDRLKAHA